MLFSTKTESDVTDAQPFFLTPLVNVQLTWRELLSNQACPTTQAHPLGLIEVVPAIKK